MDPEPKYGERVLAQYVAELARNDPERPIITISKDPHTFAKGSRVLSYRDIERGIDRLAWFLEDKLGKSTALETLAYLGPNDIRYFLLVIAVGKVRYKLLLPSPRNSISNQLHLLDKTNCRVFLKTPSANIDHIVKAAPSPLHVLDIPSVDELLLDSDVPEYPFDSKFEDIKDDPVVIFHSSGSTGQVKPIVWTHRSCASFDAHHQLRYDGTGTVPASLPDGSILNSMPFFHVAAVFMMWSSIWFDTPGALYPHALPISPIGVKDCIDHLPLKSAILPPSLLEDSVSSPEVLRAFEKLDLIMYGGGAISDKVADVVAEHVMLQSYVGSTEGGGYPIFLNKEKGDHLWLKFDPHQAGIEFRHAADDLYELVFVRHTGPQYQSMWDTFPDLTEYLTSDLYRPHPSKPGHWKHAGRADDVIVLSNGEKVSPSVMETMLNSAPEVRSVLLYGANRFQIAAVIEPEKEAQHLSHAELLDRLTPYIDKANKEVPAHAQLLKDKIIFTPPERPMVRLPKGSVARKATFIAFEMELDEVYSSEKDLKSSDKPFLKNADEDQTIEVLADIVAQISELSGLSADQDIFQSGVDSLQVITIVRLVKAQVNAEGSHVPLDLINTSLVYANPTVRGLAHAIRNLGQEVDDDDEQREKHLQSVQYLLDKYTKDLPAALQNEARQPYSEAAEEFSVILTGSTGSLGSYLLDTLMADKRVTRVFSLNRSADGRAKQIQDSTARGLSTDWGECVHFLHADLSKPLLGLDQKLYDRMVSTATHIIHNQWPVNFNIPLNTFEPHIRGVRHLVDLAAAAPHQPSILFASSIGVVINWSATHPGEPVPEAEITDAQVAGRLGYASSKYISERILTAAAEKSGRASIIVRVGQMAGSIDKHPVWKRDEWFPSIVISSQHLGVLPSSLGPMSSIDFVPMDWGAAILWDLSTSEAVTKGGAHFFNMVNAHRVPYETLVPTLTKTLNPSPKVVQYTEWVQTLRNADESGNNDTEKNPAIKLLDWFEKGLGATGEDTSEYANRFSTERTHEASKHMRELEAVKPEWMEAWARSWGLGK